MARRTGPRLIEDEINRQLSFAKRRNGLIKKALELFLVCGVDSVFISFSPSGRLSYFCGDKRFEDVLARFATLPDKIRRVHLSDAEFQEFLGILSELREETEENFQNDRTVQAIQGEISRVKTELENARTELSRKYQPSPESISMIEEANMAETTLVEALAKVRDRMRELSENQGNNASQGSGFMIEAENPSTNPSYEALQGEPENQDEMFDQSPGTESGQFTFLERNSFLEMTSTPPRHARKDSFSSLLMSADVAQPSSPRRETGPQTPALPFMPSSQPPEQSIFQDDFFNPPNYTNDHTTKGIQSSDQTETGSPDSFIFPTANLSSPNYQFPSSPTQMVRGESSGTASLFGQRSGLQEMFDSVSVPNNMFPTDVGSPEAFFKAPNLEMDPLGKRPWDQEDIAFRPSKSNDQIPPPPAPWPLANSVYSTEHKNMGLALDPHFRIFQEVIKDGESSSNGEHPNQ